MALSKSHRISLTHKWLALTTALLFAAAVFYIAQPAFAKVQPALRVLILGGGSSHNFDEMYGKLDKQTLTDAGDAVRYTSSLAGLPVDLRAADILIQASNQTPQPDAATQEAMLKFVNAGGGLVVLHAGTWYNWADWPEYNRSLIGGGTHDHDKYGEFEVTVTAPEHAVMKGMPAHFKVFDELYHQEMDPLGSRVEVLATATSPLTGETYPSVWVVDRGHGRIVCTTLGHDERTHTDPAYRRLLVNATAWAAPRR